MSNREILFRGKRKDNGEWIVGFYYLDIWGDGVTEYIMIDGLDCEVIPKSVGQYTELEDMNGKSIFEGDILKSDKFVGCVLYHKIIAAFIIEINDSTISHYHWSPFNEGDIMRQSQLKYTEIIGNIHDNPELMEGNK